MTKDLIIIREQGYISSITATFPLSVWSPKALPTSRTVLGREVEEPHSPAVVLVRSPPEAEELMRDEHETQA